MLGQERSNSRLGAASTVITLGISVGEQPADVIEGGVQRGANLFHSFQKFKVGDLQRVG